MQTHKFTVILEKERAGGYSVYVPALPGCASQGETKREALKNIREAIALYLWSLRKDRQPIPLSDVEFEEIRIAA